MMKRILIGLFLLMALMPVMVTSATYYVSTGGSDSNAGTEALPYRTIQRCANIAQAGDTCYVRQGTYNERVLLSRSGTTNAYINFVGHPMDAKPVMRGFDVDANYIRIIGFEITHTSTTYRRAVTLGSRNHVEVLNNYVHNTNEEGGAIGEYGSTASYITIRGNEIYYTNCIQGGTCSGNGWAIESGYITTNRWLVEYNHFHRVGDFVDIYGHHQIVRNNYMHDYLDSYFAQWPHVDFFQPSSGDVNAGVQYHIYESNVLGDNRGAPVDGVSQSHILQIRDTVNAGDKEVIFRGNIGYNVGAYALQAGGTDNVRLYNNAFYNIMMEDPGEANFRYNNEGNNPSIGNHNFNNIISNRPTGILFSVEGSSTLSASNNLCYNAGSHASCASTANPLFVSTATNDFHLQAGSPAIGLGKAITTVTSSSGSGTSFNVVDASFFSDGYGVADGDIIKVGSNNPVRITSISSNTIMVESSISWNNGDSVYWRNQDTLPDAGAFEYRSGGYNYGISVSSPVNNAAVGGLVTITTNPTNPELIRQVIFYIDGIPVSRDFSSPFSYAWNTAGLVQGSSHVIDAVAYPLHASTELSKSSRIVVSIGTVTPCTDVDGDGYGMGCASGSDCNDTNLNVHPNAIEVCNFVDDDCDGSTDEGVLSTYYQDFDGDNYGNASVTSQACSRPNGYVAASTDCNDANSNIHPGATEVAGDNVDQDCNGREICFRDADNDGYRLTSTLTSTDVDCLDSGEAVLADLTGECNDTSAAVHPGASEVCGNGVDEDCSGADLACSPSVCTEADWSYSDSSCLPSNTLTRAWAKIGNCQGGVTHSASEPVACQYVPIPGDLNLDGHVDIADLVIVFINFGMRSGVDADFNVTVDVAVSGEIDIGDMVFVARRYTG